MERNLGCPCVLARAHVNPTISPSGLAHMGAPWKPLPKLTGTQLGSTDGAHSPAHIQPIWALHGCVDRVVTPTIEICR